MVVCGIIEGFSQKQLKENDSYNNEQELINYSTLNKSPLNNYSILYMKIRHKTVFILSIRRRLSI